VIFRFASHTAGPPPPLPPRASRWCCCARPAGQQTPRSR